MPREVLNPGARPLLAEPVEISGALLAAAREAGDPGELTALAGALHHVDPAALIGDDRRIAFWLNLYNALFLHEMTLRPRRGNLLRHARLFDRAAYRVGEGRYSLSLIEHGILRRNSRSPAALRRPLRRGDPRSAAAPSQLDPRIHFALNCGARSCPPLRFYDDAGLDAQLRDATRSYLAGDVRVDDKRGVVTLPRLMRIYRTDFGDRRTQLVFAARHVPEVAGSLRRIESPEVEYAPYDWTIAG
jgi:Protein of unknown function, DUF547